MLINNSQLSALSSARRIAFENEVIERMRQLWPEDAARMGAELFEGFVRDGIAIAEQFDIFGDREICRFLNIRFGAGLDFPYGRPHRWASGILKSPIPPAEKNDRLLAALPDHLLA